MDVYESLLNRIANGLGKLIKMVDKLLVRTAPQKLDETIYDINTLTTFVKVKNVSFNISRVKLCFVEYDSHSHKLKQGIDIYLTFGEALTLCQDILSGRIAKMAVKSIQEAQKKQETTDKKVYAAPVYYSPLGGVNEQKAKEYNLRNDGKAVSRNFTLAPGEKADFVFTATQRAGHTDAKTKLIIPEEKAKPDATIRVACSKENLKAFAVMLEKHIGAYLASLYTTSYFAEKDSKDNA